MPQGNKKRKVRKLKNNSNIELANNLNPNLNPNSKHRTLRIILAAGVVITALAQVSLFAAYSGITPNIPLLSYTLTFAIETLAALYPYLPAILSHPHIANSLNILYSIGTTLLIPAGTTLLAPKLMRPMSTTANTMIGATVLHAMQSNLLHIMATPTTTPSSPTTSSIPGTPNSSPTAHISLFANGMENPASIEYIVDNNVPSETLTGLGTTTSQIYTGSARITVNGHTIDIPDVLSKVEIVNPPSPTKTINILGANSIPVVANIAVATPGSIEHITVVVVPTVGIREGYKVSTAKLVVFNIDASGTPQIIGSSELDLHDDTEQSTCLDLTASNTDCMIANPDMFDISKYHLLISPSSITIEDANDPDIPLQDKTIDITLVMNILKGSIVLPTSSLLRSSMLQYNTQSIPGTSNSISIENFGLPNLSVDSALDSGHAIGTGDLYRITAFYSTDDGYIEVCYPPGSFNGGDDNSINTCFGEEEEDPIYAESDFTPMEISWSGLLTAYDSGDIRRVTLVHDAANLNPTHQTAVFTKHQNSEPSLVAKIVGIEMHDSITDMIRVEPEEDDCAFNHVCSYLFYIINNGGTYKLFHTEYREQDGRTILITQNSSFGDSITADYVASTVFESSSPITNLHELSDHSVSFHNAGLIYTVSANGIVEIVENDPPQAHSPNAESTPTTETPSTPEPTDSATTITPEPETTTDIPSTPEPTEPETTTDIPSTPEPETTTDIPSTPEPETTTDIPSTPEPTDSATTDTAEPEATTDTAEPETTTETPSTPEPTGPATTITAEPSPTNIGNVGSGFIDPLDTGNHQEINPKSGTLTNDAVTAISVAAFISIICFGLAITCVLVYKCRHRSRLNLDNPVEEHRPAEAPLSMLSLRSGSSSGAQRNYGGTNETSIRFRKTSSSDSTTSASSPTEKNNNNMFLGTSDTSHGFTSTAIAPHKKTHSDTGLKKNKKKNPEHTSKRKHATATHEALDLETDNSHEAPNFKVDSALGTPDHDADNSLRTPGHSCRSTGNASLHSPLSTLTDNAFKDLAHQVTTKH